MNGSLVIAKSNQSALSLPCLLVLAIAASLRAGPPDDGKKSPSGQPGSNHVLFTIAKETTYITEPLRKDGYLDYVAAVNARSGKSATPETNAAVLLCKALGPGPINAKTRTAYFRLLGIEPLPIKGSYFTRLDDFVQASSSDNKAADKSAQEQLLKKVAQQSDLAHKRAWSKDEFPILSNWLAANEIPLALVVEASNRPRQFEPYVSDDNGALINVLLPCLQSIKWFADALAIRATLRLSEGQVAAAWTDLLAIHRLARLAGQGHLLIDGVVGAMVDEIASKGDQALVQYVRLSASDAAKFRADLARLPPLPRMADHIEYERFMFLDTVATVARGRIPLADVLDSDGKPDKLSESLATMARTAKLADVDWNVALRMGNAEYDRLTDAFRSPTRLRKVEALRQIDRDLKAMIKPDFDLKSLAEFSPTHRREVLSKLLGGTLVFILSPAHLFPSLAEDRAVMRLDLTKLGFTLAAYRAEHGVYPSRLTELVPNYLAEIPQDVFIDDALHYRRDGDGYLLYSVGFDCKDDGGKGPDDAKNGEYFDDIAIHITAKTSPNP